VLTTGVGTGRDRWLLNPGATREVHREMFKFLGKLMGYAMRSKEYLALNLSSLVWKALVGQEPTKEDLEATDWLLSKVCKKVVREITDVGEPVPHTSLVFGSSGELVQAVARGDDLGRLMAL
jgi:hypothetical protein